jgi:hypothetical protein
MIRHDDPREKSVAIVIEVLEGVGDETGDAGTPQHTLARARVEQTVDLLAVQSRQLAALDVGQLTLLLYRVLHDRFAVAAQASGHVCGQGIG